MRVRNGFVSNSSSCSYIIRLDGLEGRQLTVEDVKRYFPMNREAMERLTVNEAEEVYIALWKIITLRDNERHDDIFDIPDEFSVHDRRVSRWKKARAFNVGNDSFVDDTVVSDSASATLYYERPFLFNTGNIIVAGEDYYDEQE